MKTDDLISLLTADGTPARRLGRTVLLWTALGTVIAAVAFFSLIGFRPDIGAALQTPRFLFKFVLTGSLGLSAWFALRALSRPDAPRGWWLGLLCAPVLLLASAAIELAVTPEPSWGVRMIGHNARFCLTLIPFLSLGPLACLLLAARAGAPRNPAHAGAVAGLCASAIAATLYASNCTDDSPLYVLLWYPIAIGIVTLAGALIGRKMLRW